MVRHSEQIDHTKNLAYVLEELGLEIGPIIEQVLFQRTIH